VYATNYLPEDEIQADDFWFVCVGPHLLAGSGLTYALWRCSDLSKISGGHSILLPPDMQEPGAPKVITFFRRRSFSTLISFFSVLFPFLLLFLVHLANDRF